MLDTLTASAFPRRLEPARPARALLAAALHGVILIGAVRATAAREMTTAPHRVALIPFFSPPVVRDPALPAPRRSAAEASAAPLQVGPFAAAPLAIPVAIPPVSLALGLDPSALRSLTVTGFGVSAGTDSGAAGRVLAAAEVDEPAAVLRQPSPRYPPVLQRAGVEGRVLLEFIIDTAGHPEAASLRVVERSAPGFDLAALETIQRSLFRPARVRGRPVRQRTLQAIAFRIAPE